MVCSDVKPNLLQITTDVSDKPTVYIFGVEKSLSCNE